MNVRSAYHTLIAGYYLKPMSAEAVALALNARLQSTTVTPRLVRNVFDQEYEGNLVLQQLGERPANGFDAKEPKVQLADALMGAAAA